MRRVHAFLAAALAVFALAAPLRAQHCWPSAVAFVLRDAAGAPAGIGSGDVSVSPAPLGHPDFGFSVRPLAPDWAAMVPGGDTAPAPVWAGRGDCAIAIDTVTVRRGSEVMRLVGTLRVNSFVTLGHSVWVVDTPPFRAGTFRLRGCTLPPAKAAPALLPASKWEPVPEGEAAGCAGVGATASSSASPSAVRPGSSVDGGAGSSSADASASGGSSMSMRCAGGGCGHPVLRSTVVGTAIGAGAGFLYILGACASQAASAEHPRCHGGVPLALLGSGSVVGLATGLVRASRHD